MLVSILMSVYNNEATLGAAIDSILVQTFTDFEFIICDDGSTDRTWEIIQSYRSRDKRISVIQNTQNCGLADSLNRCLERARGIYIARQDADDISAPERLERMVEYITQNNLPYAGCGAYIFDDEQIWGHRIFPEMVTKHIIAQKNPFFHPTMVFQKEVLDMVNGYRVAKTTCRTEDYDLVMRLAGREIIGKNLQECLYYIYEPQEAYSRHTLRTRWYEILVRIYGLRQMHSPLWDYIYLCKPVIMCMVPRRLLKRLKQLQWKN